MPRLNTVTPESAPQPVKEIYDGLTQKMGKVVNIFQGMGNSPAALKAYLAMSDALKEGELSPEAREAVYLAVSESNGCHYCVSAHTAVSKGIKMSEESIQQARVFKSDDGAIQALLNFVRTVMETKGFVSDDNLAAVRDAGFTDGQIAESIAYIGLATYSNLFNHVHDTTLDFPAAPKL